MYCLWLYSRYDSTVVKAADRWPGALDVYHLTLYMENSSALGLDWWFNFIVHTSAPGTLLNFGLWVVYMGCSLSVCISHQAPGDTGFYYIEPSPD